MGGEVKGRSAWRLEPVYGPHRACLCCCRHAAQLAMTRALGHRQLAEFGVDPTPSGAHACIHGAWRRCDSAHPWEAASRWQCPPRRRATPLPAHWAGTHCRRPADGRHPCPAPAVTFHTLGPQHQALVTATDGVWEVLSPAEAVKLVCDCVAGGGSAAGAAAELVSKAVRLASSKRYSEGAADNTTASVLLFCEL